MSKVAAHDRSWEQGRQIEDVRPGRRAALLIHVRRKPALGFGLAMGLSVVPCVVGCTSTNGDAADGAAVDANARGDAPLEASGSSACLAAGGHCIADGTGCNSDLGLEDCGSQASCCYDLCS